MKKKLFTLFVLITMVYSAKAQTDYGIDSTRNEIGFSIVPLLTMVGFDINNPELIIQYKRHYSKNILRIGVFLGSVDMINSNQTQNILNLKDSLVTIHQSKDYGEYGGVKIGMERSKKIDKDWTFYAGGDLLFGYRKIDTYDDKIIYKKNNDSTYHLIEGKSDLLSTKDYFRIGISPVGGFQYYFSNGLSASFQVQVNTYYEAENTSGNKQSTISIDPLFSLMLNFHFTKR